MSAIEDIRQSLKPELERLDTLISRTLDSSNPLMNQVINNYLSHKGKQLRPMLVMLTAKLFGGVNDNALTAAASVEILHNASLIHDDVVDDSDCRHGHDTINAVWDNHVAVLVGDFFVSNALKLAVETEDLRVIRAIADLGKLLSRRDGPNLQRTLPRTQRGVIFQGHIPQDCIAFRDLRVDGRILHRCRRLASRGHPRIC